MQKQVPAEYFLLTFTLPARIPGAVYLGRYLYRGVISENDILACADGQMSFRYRDGKIGKTERRTVSGADFLWLVPQHVLPKGFRRARNFGFLHPNVKLCGARSASEPA